MRGVNIIRTLSSRTSSANPSATHDLLIVSDLHLGADLKRTGFAFLRGVATLDREFGRFLDWYGAHRESDRPWRLIVNGDMVDFINVTLVPLEGDAHPGFDVTDDERRFGLEGEETKVAWMMDRVIDRHRPLFEKLAAFLAAGNDLAIVRGNHDVEFHWPKVQDRFVQRLVALGAPAASIQFLPWFYYEKDTIFVEHGHQYDDYSSFEYLLSPVSPDAPSRVDLPLSHYAIRYLANAFPNITTHDKDGWSFFDYIRFGWSGQAGSFLALWFGYAATLRRLGSSVLIRKLGVLGLLRGRGRGARVEHAERLRALAEQWGLTVDRLALLEKLHRGVALRSAFCAAQCYYADRFALFFTLALVLAGIALSGMGAIPALALMAGCFAATLVVNRSLSKLRSAETAPKLALAGRAVALLMNVPLVVMGHSHKAAQIVDPDTEPGRVARYVNTGTWIPPRADAPGFTHLMVKRADGTAAAELRCWDAPSSAPRAL